MRVNELVFNQQESIVTMNIAPGTVVGDAVAFTAPATVGRGADGDKLAGKVLKIESDGLGTVSLPGSGFTDIPAVGTLATGFQLLVVDGAGKAKVAAGGKEYLVNAVVAGTANIQL
ncbi:hypothetical protein [Deinococcus marmoris]|uniref:Phage protein n=1 Tax=Deinococcus marmoris TaxID=249408 RepID=A0A1U7P4X0_9DEIO|nr:hypothetical protein [Deinococcus marmoris]OLV20214.1 hypothetical protein BOO71_0000670 [Deinococcus marmoris]